MASALSNPIFHSEEAAYAHVEARIWPEGPFCPHCGAVDRISAIKPNPEKRVRIGLKKCGHCKKAVHRQGRDCFRAISRPAEHVAPGHRADTVRPRKVSAPNQLARVLGVGVKTAWFMAHRIREAMADGDPVIPAVAVAILEADETFLGDSGYRFSNDGGWRKRGTIGIAKIVTVVERGGRARSIKVDSLRKEEIRRAMDVAVPGQPSEYRPREPLWRNRPGVSEP